MENLFGLDWKKAVYRPLFIVTNTLAHSISLSLSIKLFSVGIERDQ